MDKKDILQNAIIIPAVVGVVLAVCLCFYLNSNIQNVLPVPQDTAFAYHDSNADSSEVDTNNLNSNDLIGHIEFGKSRLEIRYDADYSKYVGSVSMQDGSTDFSKIGSAYLKTTTANAEIIKSENKIIIDSVYGKFEYEKIDELEFENEYQATVYAPKAPKSLVLYYQKSSGAGLTSNYKALIYKEVK